MMDRLREGVNSIAVKIILGLIILSFVFAGVGSYLVSGSSNSAAKVGNVEIGRGEFEMAYQNERNRMQSQLGDYFSQLLADPAYVESFRKSVLDRMINDVLLDQHAESLGLRISDAQVRSMILAMPEFQQDGKFNQDVYQATLRRAGYSPDSFAEYMRRELIRSQLLDALQTSEFTLPGEVDAEGKLFTQTRDVRTVTLNIRDFADKVTLTEEEIQKYYDENKSRFTRPEQVKVSYIELAADSLKQQITISDDEVKQYYQEHLDKYSSEEQRRVAHILIEGDDQAKAQAILDELNAGADFAALAQEKSDDFGSADNGGELGWIERDVMDPAFEEAAFALKNVGDVTGLVKSDFGYHIIKLEELKEPVVKPFSDVAAQIKQEMIDQKAVDQFYELQSELEKVAFEYPDSLEEASKAVGQQVKHTDFISQVDAPEILRTPAVTQAITSPEVKLDGLNSEAIEIAPEHIIVVRVDDARDETVLPLTEVQDQVAVELSQVKGEQQALELGSEVVTALKAGNTAILQEKDLSFGELEKIDRRSPLAQTVFAMAKPAAGNAVYGQSKDTEGNVVVVALEKVEESLEPVLAQQISVQLQRVSAQRDLSSIIAILRANTDIEYFVVSN
ncbi:peptidylprolyl isomerase [Vibrio vulnificus]|uniref:peptidylprolyl isomerase n=1 Tax=Vibrio vulnificus TaxID=672 RepID=UPI0010297DF2|nr:peptidylprolyl isomerase [Vibrio vulnificus]EGQ8021121.1 peptidylprolyl isomerase [Vibrio vulnificus]RZQ75137.1 peptidylprolyl isomerase [Vibrio vulnificus]RZR01317.1 peptidylprolyl isomerase [Vibrio vulnificus]RZR53759.1 peptidylprolyl isomerase [Vibrio vulnificus]